MSYSGVREQSAELFHAIDTLAQSQLEDCLREVKKYPGHLLRFALFDYKNEKGEHLIHAVGRRRSLEWRVFLYDFAEEYDCVDSIEVRNPENGMNVAHYIVGGKPFSPMLKRLT